MSHEYPRKWQPARAVAAVACALIVVVSACAPQAGPGAGSIAADKPAAKKVLTLAHQVEPVGFILDVRGGTEFTSGPEVQYIMHDALSVEIEPDAE